MYIAAPILFSFLQQYPKWRRKACVYGLLVVSLSLIISSFCRTVTALILTQGLLYALGGCFLYYPIYLFIDEWFVTRKGFAYGIMWAGSGIGGLLGPLIMGRLLTAFGFEIMIRAWGVAMLLISGPLLYFVKPRLPVSRNVGSGRWRTGWQFLTTRTFWILQAGNVVQGLGYFIPALYLPGKVLSLLSLYSFPAVNTDKYLLHRIYRFPQLPTSRLIGAPLCFKHRFRPRGHLLVHPLRQNTRYKRHSHQHSWLRNFCAPLLGSLHLPPPGRDLRRHLRLLCGRIHVHVRRHGQVADGNSPKIGARKYHRPFESGPRYWECSVRTLERAVA